MVSSKPTTEERHASILLDRFVKCARLESLPPTITPQDLFFATQYYSEIEPYLPRTVENLGDVEREVERKYGDVREFIFRSLENDTNTFLRLLGPYEFNMDTRDEAFKPFLEFAYNQITDLQERRRREVKIDHPVGKPLIKELSMKNTRLPKFMHIAPVLLRLKIRGNVGDALKFGCNPEGEIPSFFQEYLPDPGHYRLHDPVGETICSEDYFIEEIRGEEDRGERIDLVSNVMLRYFRSKLKEGLIGKIYGED